MGETILVIIVVGVVAGFTIRAFYRTLSGKAQGCSGCGDCHCDHVKGQGEGENAHH
ncbi:MAG: FeoB-associated Cys-rich membrane protein [Armatimonadota bacterium]